jgi:hypothetical protein
MWEYNKGADETDAQGLHTKTVALQFQIQNEHLTNNGRSTTPKVEIRCVSTVGDSVRYKVVYTTITKALTSNQLAQEGFRNSASKIRYIRRLMKSEVTEFMLEYYRRQRESCSCCKMHSFR